MIGRGVIFGGVLWSIVEWPQLLATGRVRFASLTSYALFIASHISLGVFASSLVAVPLLVLPLALLGCFGRSVDESAVARHRRSAAIVAIGLLQLVIGYIGMRFALGFRTRSLVLTLAVGAGPALLAARTLVGDLVRWTARARPGWSRIKLLICVSIAVGAHVLNYTYFPKQYFMFHLSLVLFAVEASVLAVFYSLSAWFPIRMDGRRRDAVIALATGIIPFALLPIRNSVRQALFVSAFDSKAVLYVGRKLTDFDRDGFSSLLGGGDCAPFDARVHPMAPERRGDGVDANCTGGEEPPLGPAALHPSSECRSWAVDRVILVVVDALRSDHLALYGYGKQTSPNLTALGSRSAAFRWAWAIAPATRESIFALFAVDDPNRKGVGLMGALHHSGVRTYAIMDDSIARHMGGWLNLAFDRRSVVPHGESAPDRDVVARARALLQSDSGRLFAWIHLHSPHYPYVMHPNGPPFGSDDIGRYDGEIYESDRALGDLIEFLDKSGQAQRTVLIVTSDHGEELWDHGGISHNGDSLYREELQVPLVMFHPRLGMRGRVTWIDQPASLRDLAPTIAELFGLCDHRLAARSLLPALAGETLPPLERAFVVGPRGTFGSGCLIDGRWKLGYVLFNDSVSLYDLVEDPNERRDLSELQPDRVRAMKRRLQSYLDSPWTESAQLSPSTFSLVPEASDAR